MLEQKKKERLKIKKDQKKKVIKHIQQKKEKKISTGPFEKT